MSRTDAAAALIVWSAILGAAAFALGEHFANVACTANEVKAERKDAQLVRRKNRQALAAGLRTETAQANTDTYFQNLRTEYENDQRQNPAAGCVLDPVSLRRWNEANAQSDGATPAEPDDGLPATAPVEGR